MLRVERKNNRTESSLSSHNGKTKTEGDDLPVNKKYIFMKTIKAIIFAAALATYSTNAAAQTLNTAYFTDGYIMRHTMNPAYGGEQSYVSVPALGNINASVQGNFGVKDVIMKNPLYGMPGEKRLTTFLNPNISIADAMSGFSSGQNKLIQDLNIAILSAGFKAFGGYNTVEINVKETSGVSLPYELMEFAKNIGNNNYAFDDIKVGGQAYAEIAFGHSRKINEKLSIGAKAKVLLGIARADMEISGLTADLSSNEKWTLRGQGVANVSMKGFKYLSEKKEYNVAGRPPYEQVNDIDVDGAGIGGLGMAVDLGGVYKINDDWTVSAAVLDLGFISWSNNMEAVNNGTPFEFNGFHDVAVSREDGGEKLSDKTDKLGDQFTDFVHLKDNGDKGSRTATIGTTINLAGEYTLPVYRKVKFGILSSTRIRGEYSWTEGRLSANYSPLKWINGGVSVSVSSFATSMGWTLNIHPKGYNFFIGMDRLIGKVSKEGIPLNSNVNVAMGMAITW